MKARTAAAWLLAIAGSLYFSIARLGQTGSFIEAVGVLAVFWTFFALGQLASHGPSVAEMAVIRAACQWLSDRRIGDWDEAELAKAVCTLAGDWAGCPDCDHECDEPCTPATVKESHAMIDHQIAQLIHEGKLLAYVGYEPPKDWQPSPARRRRVPIHKEANTVCGNCDTPVPPGCKGMFKSDGEHCQMSGGAGS